MTFENHTPEDTDNQEFSQAAEVRNLEAADQTVHDTILGPAEAGQERFSDWQAKQQQLKAEELQQVRSRGMEDNSEDNRSTRVDMPAITPAMLAEYQRTGKLPSSETGPDQTN